MLYMANIFFWLLITGLQQLNIFVGSLETSHVSNLYDYQPLPCVPYSNSIAQAGEDVARSFGINKNSFCPLLFDVAKYMVAEGTAVKSL